MYAASEQFYKNLSQACGALQIACLRSEHIEPERLQVDFRNWLEQGNAALLPYLEKRFEQLSDPFGSRPWAKSLLILSFLPVTQKNSPLYSLPAQRAGHPCVSLAGYLLNEDYHISGRNILQKLVASLSLSEGSYEFGVDSSPLFEKYFASLAGLGNYGFNNLIRNDYAGSLFHLAYLFTAEELPICLYDTKSSLACEDCLLCVENCPTKALKVSGLDISLCRSWLANEKRGFLSWSEQQLLSGTLASCSLCSVFCPAQNNSFTDDLRVDAENLALMSSSKLSRIIKGTALDYIGAVRLKRNAVATLGVQLALEERLQMKKKILSVNNSEAILRTVEQWPCGFAEL